MDDDQYRKVLNAAFRFISIRPRSRSEISAYLTKKSTNETVKKAVLERLTELGYASDTEFARWWSRSRRSAKPYGRRVIAMELRRKGVAREVSEQILSEAVGPDTESERELAARAAAKHLPKLRSQSLREIRNKLYALLYRRGFDTETAVAAIDELLGKDYNT